MLSHVFMGDELIRSLGVRCVSTSVFLILDDDEEEGDDDDDPVLSFFTITDDGVICDCK